MQWNKYTIKSTTEAEDFISAALAELGVQGIEIEDKQPLTDLAETDMFIDVLPELPEDDGISYISFYLDIDVDNTALLQDVKDALEELRLFVEIGDGTIEESKTEDVDWINNWKEFFHSFTIENILIKPTWEDVAEEDADKLLIEIDPGVSFGTGKHETTQLCIKELQKYISNAEGKPSVLDIGFGSGILSIVALKLGAAFAKGTDIDENCITSGHQNMEVNGIDESLYEFMAGNLIDDTELQNRLAAEPYDIVVANILADVIIPMAPVIPMLMKPGATLITSGIIDFREDSVKQALIKAGLEIVSVNYQGEWVNITAKKPE